MNDWRLLESGIWRDGGSYSATITDGSTTFSYYLQVASWDHPAEQRSYEELFVSAGHDASSRERAISIASPEFVSVLRSLRGVDDRAASDDSRRRFGEMIEAMVLVMDGHDTRAGTSMAHPSRATRIRCNTINYRKGFIEIVPLIHDGCINVEAWSVHPETDISQSDLCDDGIPDDAVTGNIEIELNADEAEQLIEALRSGLRMLRAGRPV